MLIIRNDSRVFHFLVRSENMVSEGFHILPRVELSKKRVAVEDDVGGI